MDAMRRKQLMEEYKHRRPEKGVISYRCKETGVSYLGISKDTRADFNSTNVKLAGNSHPNKEMQAIYNQYGQAGFDISVLKVLKYKDPADNHTAELEELREKCLAADPKAKKIWR